MSTAASGTQDWTIPGFGTPKAAIFISNGGITDATQAADLRLGIGFCDGSTEFAIGITSADNVGTQNTATASEADCLLVGSIGIGYEALQGFSSFITDGVRMTINNQASSAWLVTLILIGGDDVTNVHVGSEDLGTTATAIDVTAPGFEPDVVFAALSAQDSLITGFNTHSNFSFGCCINDGFDTQRDIAYWADDNQATSVVCSRLSTDSICSVLTNAVLQYQVSVDTFDANGFTFNTSSSAANDDIMYLALKFANNPTFTLIDVDTPVSGTPVADWFEDGPQFQPDFVLMTMHGGGLLRDTLDATSDVPISFVTLDESGAISQNVLERDNVGTMFAKSRSDDNIWMMDGAGNANYDASAFTFEPYGWKATTTTRSAVNAIGFAFVMDGAGVGPVAATFENNTIIEPDPLNFDESPIIGSPEDVSYIWTGRYDLIKNNTFLFPTGGKHAINMTRESRENFVGNQFNEQWLDGTSPDGNGTADAALYNAAGVIVLDILSGGVTPTVLDKQSPGTTLNNNIAVTLTNLQPNSEVRVYSAESTTSPIDIVELATGVENSGSPSEHTFNLPAGTLVDIVVFHQDYILPPNNRIVDFTVPGTDTSFPVTQILDRNFSNP
jgi:hypothetical protein